MAPAIVRFVLSAFFAAAGVLHFTQTAAFASIIPFLPAPETVVRLTGLIEIALALAILVPAARRTAGVLLALYCLAVLPANVFMALEGTPVGDIALPAAALWARVALQFPLIALILWATRKA